MIDIFTGGPIKDKIRKELDAPLIKITSKDGREKLPYFGLSGPLLYDIIEWQDYLKDFTVVEKSYTGRRERSIERNRQELLLKTSFIIHLKDSRGVINDFLTVLYGDIDKDIILNGKGDFDKELPKKYFGLIYLDYYGGIFKAKYREDAIKKLIHNQKEISEKNQDYVLLITVENLDRGKREKNTLISEILDNLEYAQVDSKCLTNFKRYISSCSYGLLQKIYVPIQIYLYIKSCGDEIRCFDPIIYREEKIGSLQTAEMIHFRFVIFIKKNRKTAAPMIKDIIDIYNLKLLTVEEGKIVPCREQTPKLLLKREKGAKEYSTC
jgi:hypothetical protein